MVIGFVQSIIVWFNEVGDVLGIGGILGVLFIVGIIYYIVSISVVCGIVIDIVIIVVDDFVLLLFLGFLDMLKICVGNDIIIDFSIYGYFYVWLDCEGQEILVNNNMIEISGNEVGEQCFLFCVFNVCGVIEELIMVYVVLE